MPAILIFRLLLCMRHMYIASIHLDFHKEWLEYTKRNLIMCILTFYLLYSDHTCFFNFYAKQSIGAKAFGPPIIVAHPPY